MLGLSIGTLIGIAGLGISAVGLYENLSAAEDASRLGKESREKQAKYNLEKIKIAKQIQDRANQIHGIWITYYLPREIETINEICSEPLAIAHTKVVSQRAIAEISKVFAVAKKNQVYCLTPQQVGIRLESEVALSIRQADTTAGQVRIAVRTENARVNLLNKQRMASRINIINPGRRYAAETGSLLATAAAEYGALSKQESENIANASRAVGRSLAGAVTNGQEILKAVKTYGSTIRTQEPIIQEPIYKDFFERQDARVQPLNVTVNVDNTGFLAVNEENL